jgi:hypothetical protein
MQQGREGLYEKKMITAHFHMPKLYQQAEVLNELMYQMAKINETPGNT